MSRKRKPHLTQHVPTGPRALFEVVPSPGKVYWSLDVANGVAVALEAAAPEVARGIYWEFVLTDNNSSSGLFWSTDPSLGVERPEFRYAPPKKGNPFTVAELACASASHLAEGRGLISIREFKDGVAAFAAVFVANNRHAFCLWSTDATRAKPVDAANMAELAREKIAEARQKRQATKAVSA